MKTIYLPSRINVGYINRDNTYTGKLAYIIYFDEKGVLRKETSWQSWRDQSISNEIFDNEPTEGFVLNKKAGGYSTGWNHRQTYTRIYDPRGFEFEITVDNLLYILENTNSVIGKGLEGSFVYGWSGKDLILVPCASPDYKQIKEYSKKISEKLSLKPKDLVVGGTYLNKSNEQLVYMGKFPFYDNSDISNSKKYFFALRKDHASQSFTEYVGLQSIIDVISNECCDDFSDIWSKFEYYENYNYYDRLKDKYIAHSLESFRKYVDSCSSKYEMRYIYFFVKDGKKIEDKWNRLTSEPCMYYIKSEDCFEFEKVEEFEIENPMYNWRKKEKRRVKFYLSFEETFKQMQPHYKKEYLNDGKLRKVRCYE